MTYTTNTCNFPDTRPASVLHGPPHRTTHRLVYSKYSLFDKSGWRMLKSVKCFKHAPHHFVRVMLLVSESCNGMASGDDNSSSDASLHILEEEYADDTSNNSDEVASSSNPSPPSVVDLDAGPSEFDPTDCKSEEKYDITSSLEHLIVSGNYYRHQHWRVREWKRTEDGKSMNILTFGEVDKDKISKSGDGNCGQRKRSFKRRRTDSKSESNTSQFMIHAQDARIYTPDSSGYSNLEPVPWPKRPCIVGKETYVPDRKWADELSDQLHPVSFSLMRLSCRVSPPMPTINSGELEDSVDSRRPLNYDLDPDDRSDDISPNEALRAMLLHCWERAVHAASSSILVEPFKMEYQPNDRPRIMRSRDDALKMCEKLQLHYQSRMDAVNVDADQHSRGTNALLSRCSSCRTAFLSESQLQDHFWGNPSIEGCCWKYIEHQRQQKVADTLTSEVRALLQQLLCLVMRDLSPIESGDSRASTLLDGFDVWRLLQNQLALSRTVTDGSDDSRENVYETLEVERFQPPLPINAAVLESVLLRLVDRYGHVPR
jgi:hypothetical protein